MPDRVTDRLLFLTLLVMVLGSPLLQAQEASTLESRLMPLIESHKGNVAVAVRHLETGEQFAHRSDVPQSTASLIKFPLMIEAYRQAAAGIIRLDQTITLTETDKVPGSGILTRHFSPGATFSLRDAIRLMIVYSDNTATNLVLDVVGIPATAASMESFGLVNTKLHSKVFRRDTSAFPERSVQFGLGSTTAAEMVWLCEALHKKQLVSPEASEAMLDHMLACEDPDKFPRFLPEGTKLAMKTGSISTARTAAGILYTPNGPVALCVLTDQNEDQSWTPENAGNRLCADIARAVYDHYAQAPDVQPRDR